jgi:hypothetical protein
MGYRSQLPLDSQDLDKEICTAAQKKADEEKVRRETEKRSEREKETERESEREGKRPRVGEGVESSADDAAPHHMQSKASESSGGGGSAATAAFTNRLGSIFRFNPFVSRFLLPFWRARTDGFF